MNVRIWSFLDSSFVMHKRSKLIEGKTQTIFLHFFVGSKDNKRSLLHLQSSLILDAQEGYGFTNYQPRGGAKFRL